MSQYLASSQRARTEKILKRLFFTFLIGYLPLGAVVALLTPDDILSNPLARHFTDFLSIFVPLVRETGRLTTIPATQFIAAVMNSVAICAGIVLTIGLIKTWHKYAAANYEWFTTYRKEHPVKHFVVTVLFPLGLSAVFILMNVQPYQANPTTKQRIMLGSKIGMGTYGSGLSICMWLGIVLAISIVFMTIAARRHTRKQNTTVSPDT